MKDEFISMIKKARLTILLFSCVELGESDSRVRRQEPVRDKAACDNLHHKWGSNMSHNV